MKILFLAPANSIHTVKWVNALEKCGNDICLVSLPSHRAIESLNSKIKVIYLPFGSRAGYYTNGFSLKMLLKKFAPDIINVHYASGYGTLMRISKFPRNKSILSVWGSDVYDFPYKNRFMFNIIRKNLKYAAYIASTSHCMEKQVRRLIKIDKEIAVTPFGVDTELFSHTPLSSSEIFTFGSMKALEYKYGIDILIKAFAKFLAKLDVSEQNSVYLKIYGKGSLLKELQLLTESLGISKQVKFCGFINNALVAKALNNIDVLCLTSIINSESFGVAALEAMACQVPVIASDVDGYKEVIVHEKTGIIVPKKSIDSIYLAMKRLYENAELRKNLGKNGRKWVKENYEWDQCVKNMLNIYQKIYLENN